MRQPQSNEIVVGVVLGPWGIKGGVRVKVLSDIESRFEIGSVIHLGGHPVHIIKVHPHKDVLRIHFDSINTRDEAEKYKGSYLTINEKQAIGLPESTYYLHEILGLTVYDEQGETVGHVNEVLKTGANDVYVVQHHAKPDLLLPAIRDVILRIDLQMKTMTIRIPEIV